MKLLKILLLNILLLPNFSKPIELEYKYFVIAGLSVLFLSFLYNSYTQFNRPHNWITDSGTIGIKKINISGVDSIVISNIGTLILCDYQNDTEDYISITADTNILPYINIVQNNNLLSLGVQPNTLIQTNTGIKYHAVLKTVNAITSANNTTIKTKNVITEPTFTINAYNNAEINVELNVSETLHINCTNNSTIKTKGMAVKQNIRLGNNADYNGQKLISDIATINASNISTAQVYVTKLLHNCNLSNISRVICTGKPMLSNNKCTNLSEIVFQ